MLDVWHQCLESMPSLEGAHELVTQVEKALRGPSFHGRDREMAKKVQRKAKKMAQPASQPASQHYTHAPWPASQPASRILLAHMARANARPKPFRHGRNTRHTGYRIETTGSWFALGTDLIQCVESHRFHMVSALGTSYICDACRDLGMVNVVVG